MRLTDKATTAGSVVKMWIAFVSYIVVNIPAGYILAFPLGLGIYGLFIAFSLGLFVAAALFFSHYRKVMNNTTR